MTYTGHKKKAAVLILCGLFVIVLGLGKYDSIAANPFIEQTPDNGVYFAGPAPTKLHNFRVGDHPGFTRMVFDSEGARPLSIGPASSEEIGIRFDDLALLCDPKRFLQRYPGAVAKIRYQKEAKAQSIFVTFQQPETHVQSFFLEADPPKEGSYRLVLDLYPPADLAVKDAAYPTPKVDFAKIPEKMVKTSLIVPEASPSLETKVFPRKAEQPTKIIPLEVAPRPDRLSAQLDMPGPQEEAARISEQPQKIVPLEVPPEPAGASTRPGLTPSGYTSRYFHLERPKVGLGLSYEIEEVRRQASGNQEVLGQASGNETRDTSKEFRERLLIDASGWAYHPALCIFTLDFVPEWAQTKRELDPGGSGSDSVYVPSYALDAIFLEPKPYTLHTFASRRELKLRSAFSEPTDTTIDIYGTDLRLKYYKVLPTFFKYTHTDTDQSGFFDSTGVRDDFNLSSQYITKNSTTTLNSLYSDDERTSGGGTAKVKTFDSNLGNDYLIAGDKRKTLFSTLRYRLTDTESQETIDYSLTENLFWRYTDKLFTDYILSYGKRDTDTFSSAATDFRARLQHLLYENLTTTISSGANLNDFTGGKENTYSGNLDLLYQRDVPWGILSLTSGWDYRYTTREGSETLIPVIDELHVLSTGEVTLLDNENVNLDSIVVTDISGTIPYIENVDYTIEEINSFVRISRTTVGAIANGQTVQVDYRFFRDPAFDDTIFNQAYNIQYHLWNALILSYGYQHADQNIVSGTPPDNIVNDTTQAAEIRLDLGWTDTRFKVQDRDRSNGTSTRRWLASQTFRIRPTRRLSFDITGSYGKTEFTDVEEMQTQYGGSSRLVWTPAGWCRFRLEGFLNKITGDVEDRIDSNFFAGLELSYRIWRGSAGYYYDKSGSSDTYRNRHAMKFEIIRILW